MKKNIAAKTAKNCLKPRNANNLAAKTNCQNC